MLRLDATRFVKASAVVLALFGLSLWGGAMLGADEDDPELEFRKLTARYQDLSKTRDYLPERERGEIMQKISNLQFDKAKDPAKLRTAVGQFVGQALDADSSERVKVRALLALGKLSDVRWTKGIWAFAEGYMKKDSLYFERLPDAMAFVSDEESIDFVLKKKLLAPKPLTRQIAAESLGNMKAKAAVAPLIQLVADKEFPVRYEAILALGKIGDAAAVQPLIDRLADGDGRIREAAAFALGELKSEAALGELHKIIHNDTEPMTRESAVMAIRAIGSKDSIDALIGRVSEEPMLRIKERITETLRGLTGAEITAYDSDIWRSWWEVNKNKTAEEIAAGSEETLPESQRSVVKYYDIDVLSNRVVFILDVSCSMEWGNRISVVKEEFLKTLDQLNNDTMFDIVRFASDFRSWTRDGNVIKKETGKAGTMLIKATPEHKEQAREWVDKLLPGGGTNTFETIDYTFSEYPDVDTIYFLSDGAPSLGRHKLQEKILAEFKKMNRYRKVQIYTIAVLVGGPKADWGATGAIVDDKGVCVDFMRRLAEENRGVFVLRADPADDELLTEEERKKKEEAAKGSEEKKGEGGAGGM